MPAGQSCKIGSIMLLTCGLLMLGLLTAKVAAQDAKVRIEAREPWTNLFADKDVVLHFRVTAPAGFKGRVAWTFAAAANQRVYDRGRGEEPLAGQEKPATIKVPLRTPPLKPRVIQEAEVTVAVTADGAKEPATSLKKKIWIFPADPFALKKEMLKELKIKVYDLADKSKTAAALKELEVPFDEVARPADFADVQEGVILVGEGFSWQDDAELFPALDQAARRGVRVLCLAPKAGSFPFPTDDKILPEGLALQRQEIIRTLDKRLDAVAWAPAGALAATSILLAAEEGKVMAQVLPHARGWLWVALEYPDKKGRLVVATFSMLRSWEASPAPRYLLARILESMAPQVEDSKKKE